MKKRFQRIADSRHWLFHSTSKRPSDFGKLIASMGTVLRGLAGIRTCVENGVEWDSVRGTSKANIVWKWNNYRYDITRPICVKLRLDERMSIPLNENKICGVRKIWTCLQRSDSSFLGGSIGVTGHRSHMPFHGQAPKYRLQGNDNDHKNDAARARLGTM